MYVTLSGNVPLGNHPQVTYNRIIASPVKRCLRIHQTKQRHMDEVSDFEEAGSQVTCLQLPPAY